MRIFILFNKLIIIFKQSFNFQRNKFKKLKNLQNETININK